jgi:Xaa-Pro aminopeptidase
VAILGAAPVFPRNNDTEHPYRQDSDFFYLTGLDEPESVAILTNRHRTHRYVLFVRPRDPVRETWDGPRVGVDGARTMLGADAAFPISELAERLPDYLAGAPRVLHSLGRNPSLDSMLMASWTLVRRRQRMGVLAPTTLIDLSAIVHPMRWKKSSDELSALRRAVLATTEGHLAAMRATRPGRFEFEIESELLSAFRAHGCERPAYEPIVGSGPNATILHYRKSERRMNDGELLLIDAGGEFGYQAADVTRTFPVNARWSCEQRAVYDVVLRTQEAAIAACRPGATLEAIHAGVVRQLTEGLIELGLIEGPLDEAVSSERYKAFYMHRTSHWLGMDVHDVGSYFEYAEDGVTTKPRALEAGCVLTIEPGLYIAKNADVPDAWKGIGIRIEDDILVTEGAPAVLTAAIPKTPEAIERAMRG